MIESLSNRVTTLAVTELQHLRQAVSSGHARRCAICDSVEFNGHAAEYEAGCWAFSDRCDNCGIYWLALVFYFRVEAAASYEVREIESMGCHHDCDSLLRPKLTTRTFNEATTYEGEYAEIMDNRIENHHVSYEPEITVPVCSRCHGQIHNDTAQYEAFEADMKRKEWER